MYMLPPRETGASITKCSIEGEPLFWKGILKRFLEQQSSLLTLVLEWFRECIFYVSPMEIIRRCFGFWWSRLGINKKIANIS